MRYIKPEPYYEVAGEFELAQAETHVSNTYNSNTYIPELQFSL